MVLGVSVKSTEQWEENYATHGLVKPPRLISGHPKLLTPDMIDNIQMLLYEDPTLLLGEINEWLTLYHNQPISTMALYMTLQDLTFSHKQLKWVAAEHNDAYHRDWILNMTMNYNADQLVFLDESSKDKHVVLCRYGCTPKGQDAVHHVSLDQ